jgi:hypothetical protein
MADIERTEKDWRLTDPRHDAELWAFEYDIYSYLESVSHEDLDQRYKEIVNNVERLVCPLRDTPPARAHFISSWWWLKVKFQTEREYSRRGKALPALNAGLPVRDRPVPCIPTSPNEGNFVVRYGEAKWLEPMLREGVIRIKPASKYKDEVGLTDIARHDDELNSHRYVSGKRVTIRSQSGQVIPVLGNLQHTIGGGDYYVLCCSHEFDYRLFSAFRNAQGKAADACLVINNVDEFATRLNAAMQERLKNWDFYWNPMFYFDPYNVLHKQKTIPGAHKDFKHAYQREYRFLWFPLFLDPSLTIEALDLKIGSLKDIATLHYYQE